MHAVAEAQAIMFSVPRLPFEKMGDYIRRSGGVFGLTPSQAKKIAYNEVKDLRASRLDGMRAKLQQIQQGAEKRRELMNDTQQRLIALRSHQGSGTPGGDSRGASPLGERGHGTLASGGSAGGGNAAARPDRD